MRISLESYKHFSCSPRQFSYTEEDKLQQILDQYPESGIIRPSIPSMPVYDKKENRWLAIVLCFPESEQGINKRQLYVAIDWWYFRQAHLKTVSGKTKLLCTGTTLWMQAEILRNS